MDQWLQAGLTVLGSGIASYLAISLKVARHDERIRRIEQDIGTHDSGMRAQIHAHASMLTQHEMRLETLERKVDPR